MSSSPTPDSVWKTFCQKMVHDRYFRGVLRYPEGAIVHHGDCYWYRCKICTCGLLHDLLPLNEDASNIYPKFAEEFAQQEEAAEKLNDNQKCTTTNDGNS